MNKIDNFYYVKDLREMEIQVSEWEKIFGNHTSSNDSARIYIKNSPTHNSEIYLVNNVNNYLKLGDDNTWVYYTLFCIPVNVENVYYRTVSNKVGHKWNLGPIW